MKTFIFWVCLTIASLSAVSKPASQPVNQIIGTWKFNSQSKTNDFQKIFSGQANYQTEHFTFESNHRFTHVFTDKTGNPVKTLNGRWKFIGDKVRISYSGIEYSITADYFYIGTDLVLGKNFNHVVFTRENNDFLNVAAK